MCENYEHILACLRASGRINKRLCDVRVIHVQITPQNTPQNTLKRRDTCAVDGASDESVSTSVHYIIISTAINVLKVKLHSG